jgi:predicted ArsR family transcriptional regulator
VISGEGTAGPQSPAAGRRDEVLRVLAREARPLTIGEIARRLGIHPNTVRFHLDALSRSGQVERAESGPRSTGRPPLRFRAVRTMDPTGPRHYRLLAEILVQGLAAEPRQARRRAVEAGQAWGRRLAEPMTPDDPDGTDPADSVDRLMALLDDVGFAPEPRGPVTRREIGLRRCPFLELAEERSDIVCQVHLGMMQGAMQAWRSPLSVDRLDPFAEPDLCLTHLRAIGS